MVGRTLARARALPEGFLAASLVTGALVMADGGDTAP
jgi:hypothetical protein